MATLNAIGWCDSNMQRTYPFADDATCMSNTPGIALPRSFLVDLQLVVPELTSSLGAPEAQFFVSTITRTDGNFRVELSYRTSAATSVVCATTGDIPATTVNTDSLANRTYTISAVGNSPGGIQALDGLSGRLIVGSCMDMADIGTLTFPWEATKIIDVRVYMYDNGLKSMTFVSSSGSYVMYDDVTIAAGDGIDFQVSGNTVTVLRTPTEEEEEEASGGLASVNDVLGKLYQELGSPIRLINGLAPNDNGNFVLDGGDCVDVTNRTGGVIISNPCAQPCCDDSSVGDVRASLDLLEDAQRRLESYYEALTININSMQSRLASLIASRK